MTHRRRLSGAPAHRRHRRLLTTVVPLIVGVLGVGALGVGMVIWAGPAGAAGYENSVGLATAGSYSVLGASTSTNTGPTTLSGDLGVNPGTSITGTGGSLVVGGATRTAGAATLQAQNDSTTAYNTAAGRAPTGASLGSAIANASTFQPGVYKASSALDVSGAVTLDGLGDPNSVFIFQVGSALTTASSTSIVLTGDAQACNVFWQVTSSATVGTTTHFVGTILALTSITLDTGATVKGRALAQTGAVTMDDNVFTSPDCANTVTSTTLSATPATTGGTTTLTATVTAVGANAPAGTVTFTANGVTIGTSAVGANGVATLTVPTGSTPITTAFAARFNGLGSYVASTSTTTSLIIAAPPTVTPTVTPTLPSTGTDHLFGLIAVGGSMLALGITLTGATRRRHRFARGG